LSLKFNLNKPGIEKSTAPLLIGLIGSLRQLARLELEFIEIDFPAQFFELMMAVRGHPNLKYLNLDHGKVRYN